LNRTGNTKPQGPGRKGGERRSDPRPARQEHDCSGAVRKPGRHHHRPSPPPPSAAAQGGRVLLLIGQRRGSHRVGSTPNSEDDARRRSVFDRTPKGGVRCHQSDPKGRDWWCSSKQGRLPAVFQLRNHVQPRNTRVFAAKRQGSVAVGRRERGTHGPQRSKSRHRESGAGGPHRAHLHHVVVRS
jgi:hypothetical protein